MIPPVPLPGRTLQLTVTSMKGPSGSFCLYTCEQNDLFLNTRHMFFQRRDSLILALCGLCHKIGMRFLSCRPAVAWVCVYSLISGFSWGEFC